MNSLRAVGVVLGICVVALSACNKDSPSEPSRPSVEYRVTGSASSVSLTYANASGGTAQIGSAAVPWTTSFTCFEDRQFLYLSAQNLGSSGNVTATIFKNGLSYKTTTSIGGFVIAQVDGTCD